MFEKRAPALATNLFFIYLAPFFETFLIMNSLFGYKEGPRMEKVFQLIKMDIAEYQESKQAKQASAKKAA